VSRNDLEVSFVVVGCGQLIGIVDELAGQIIAQEDRRLEGKLRVVGKFRILRFGGVEWFRKIQRKFQQALVQIKNQRIVDVHQAVGNRVSRRVLHVQAKNPHVGQLGFIIVRVIILRIHRFDTQIKGGGINVGTTKRVDIAQHIPEEVRVVGCNRSLQHFHAVIKILALPRNLLGSTDLTGIVTNLGNKIVFGIHHGVDHGQNIFIELG